MCGTSIGNSSIRSHVGSVRCVMKLHANGGVHADPWKGPAALALGEELERLVKAETKE